MKLKALRKTKFRKKLARLWRYELVFLVLIVAYIYANVQVITGLPDTVLDTVIIEIMPINITVERVLIGLAPQINEKWLRDRISDLGTTTMTLAERRIIL